MRLTEEERPTHANLDCSRRRSKGTTSVSRPGSTETEKNYRKITSRRSFVVGDGDNEDKDNCPGTPDGRASSKSEIIVLKPGKHSSQAPFRIQVTVHRPLSWQLSSSSSTYSLPQQIHQHRRHHHHHHHRLRRSGSSPSRNVKKHEHECQNEISKPLSKSPTENSPRIMYTDVKRREGFLKNISIMNGKCDAEWSSPSRRRGRRMKRIQMSSTQTFSDQSSTADEEEQAGDGIYADEKKNRKEIPRLRKPLKKLTSSLSTESTALLSENEENHNPNLLQFHRHFSLKFPTEGEPRRQRQGNRRRKGTQSLTAGRHEDETTGENAKTVMTWFRQARNSVHKKSGMGATGSTHSGGGGRLKSRSQSSSALYCIKSNNNGQLVGDGGGMGHHRQLHASTTADYPYRHSGSNPLSTSIPADLWDLAPTTKSFSPITRKHSRPHLEHQQSAEYPSETSATTTVESKNQKNKHRPFPFVDAFIHRASEKHAKKGKGRGGSGGSSSGGGREKFYAVSCPDVAQEANNSNSFRGSSFSSASQHRVNNSTDYGCSSGRSTAFDQYDSQRGDGRSSSCTSTTLGNNNQSSSFKPRSNSSSCRGHPSTHRHHPHCHNQHHHPHHNSHHRQQQQQQHPLHHQQQQQQQQYQQQFHPAAYYQNSGSQPIRYGGEEDCRQTPIIFPFITEADIFEIRLIRDHRGLGLSVTGGSDSEESYPGLIRIKKVFPMSPAFQSGRLRPWDIILKANGVPLTGLTNHEALEVLRTTPVETILTVCRPPAFIPGFHILEQSNNSQSQPVLSQLHSPSYEDPYQEEQHRRQLEQQQQLEQQEQQHQNNSANAFNPSVKSKSLSSLKIPTNTSGTHLSSGQYGEFEVTLEKINGSLGFTLRQEDTSILGHYVRALVKDPALTDGRIQPGDRILSVNGYDLSGVSHADAIAFLRQCPPKVTLRLYRDISPTPVSPLSPTESHRSKKTKPLRQEAIDMLNDLALRKRMSGSESKSSLPSGSRPGLRSLSKQLSSQDDKGGSASATPPNGSSTLPRRRHAPGVTPSPEVLSAALDRFAGRSATPKSAKSGGSPESVKSSRNNLVVGNYPVEARSSGSGESTPAGTTTLQRANRTHHGSDQVDNGKKDSVSSESSLEGGGDGGGRMRRPSFRQYTLHLDRISSIEDESFSSDLNHTDSIVSEPGFGSSPKHESNFRHGQPAYQSAILPSTARPGLSKKTKRSKDDSDKCSAGRAGSPDTMSDIDAPSGNHQKTFVSSKASLLLDSQQMTRQASDDSAGDVGSDSLGESNKPSTSKSTGSSGGLLKWKGVVFSQENNASDGDNGSGDKDRTGDDEDDDLESSATSTLSLRDTFPGCSSSNKRDQRKLRSDQPGDEDGGSHACYDNLDYDIDGDDDEDTEPVDGTSIFPHRRSSPDGREFRDCDMMMEVTNSMTDCNGEQIFTVQLNRRWCSRLGFSLQGCDGHTFISAIYPDSVAAKDGRLRVGDEIIMVNNETIRDVDTAQVIDMMRKTRGVMNITILRKSNGGTSQSDSPNSPPLNPT